MRKISLWKATVLGIMFLLMVIGLILISRWEKRAYTLNTADSSSKEVLAEEVDENLLFYNGDWYQYRDGLTTFLVMGVDKFEDDPKNQYNNGQQSDFLLLLVLDEAEQKCTPIQINRDTIADFSLLDAEGNWVGSYTGQITLSHAYGTGKEDSCLNTAQAVSNLFYEIEIDHYIAVTMDAVEVLNDQIGGVTLTVLDDFSAVSPELIKGKQITLQGKQALTYVRARKGLEDSSNLHRMKRQQQYVSAFRSQFEKSIAENSELLSMILMEISPYMVSDCTVNQLGDLYEKVEQYRIPDIQTLDGESVQEGGYMAFYPDEDALRLMVMELFYDRKENP